MTRPIYEPSLTRTDATLGYGSDQLFRRPAPASSFGLPFCYAQTSSVSVDDGGGTSSNVADFGTATTFKTNSTLFPAIFNDPGNIPEYGIQVPAGYLAKVYTWVDLLSDIADGSHHVGWIIDGAYTVSQFGVADGSDATSSAFSATGLADDNTAPEAIYHVAFMGDTLDFVVGTFHDWEGWTTGPLDFQYGINVTLVGDLPV